MSQTTNTFTDGLILDYHPLTAKNTALTNALNATLVTSRGNEMVLQNDLGNQKIKYTDGEGEKFVQLPEGYIPIGIKEYHGIIYICSVNNKEIELDQGKIDQLKEELNQLLQEDAEQKEEIFDLGDYYLTAVNPTSDQWNIQLSNNNFVITTNKVIKITYTNGKTTYYNQKSGSTTDIRPIDLGLSVKWANKYLGASDAYSLGSYVGWGDITGQLKSPDATKYGPSDLTHIAGNRKYDIATAMLGEGWRLPTLAECREFLNLTFERHNTYFTFKASNGNSIHFAKSPTFNYDGNPYTEPSLSWNNYATRPYFWIDEAVNKERAYGVGLEFDNLKHLYPSSIIRYKHLQIRAVYDGPDIPGGDDTTTKTFNIPWEPLISKIELVDGNTILDSISFSYPLDYSEHTSNPRIAELTRQIAILESGGKNCEIGTFPSPDYNNTNNIIQQYKPLENVKNEGFLRTKYLNFSLEHPVDIEVQPSYDGSVNLILNDGYNIPRLINSGFSVLPNGTYQQPERYNNEANKIDISSPESFDISTSLIKRVTTFPKIKYNGVLDTGDLKVGNYSLYLKYCDDDGNETDYVAESGIISIFKGKDGDPFSIDGGIENMNANKSIHVTVENIDTVYRYINVYYTRSSSAFDSGRTTLAYKIDKKFPIIGKKCDIVINGNENTTSIPLSEINSQYFVSNTVQAQAQCQNILFLGNVKSQDPQYADLTNLSYRIYPTGIRKEAIKLIGHINPETYQDDSDELLGSEEKPKNKNEYYNTKNIYEYVGYWNEEYYRLGVVYVFQDNSKSPVYNIAGRTITFDNVTENGEEVLEEDISKLGDLYDPNNPCTILENLLSPNNIDGLTIEGWNRRGVIHINDTSDAIKEKEYIYSIKINVPEEVETDLIKRGVKGMFFVRQKRIPTIAAQGYTLPWDKEAKVPIVEYLDYRLMPQNNDIWHTKWDSDGSDNEDGNKKIGDLNMATELGRRYFVESFMAQFGPGGRHMSQNDGEDQGYVGDRAIINDYKARLHDILFLTIDNKMLDTYKGTQPSGDSYISVDFGIDYYYNNQSITLSQAMKYVASGKPISCKSYGTTTENFTLTPTGHPTYNEEKGDSISYVIVYKVDNTEYNSIYEAVQSQGSAEQARQKEYYIVYKEIKYYSDNNTVNVTLATNSFKISPDITERTYTSDNTDDPDVSAINQGYVREAEYYRDQFFNVDGSIINKKGFEIKNKSKSYFSRKYGDGKIRRFGNQYMNWNIFNGNWQERYNYPLGDKDNVWNSSAIKHFYNLYKYCDGRQLTAICPEFEVRQNYFNTLFTGSKFNIKYLPYQQGVLKRSSYNERYYSPIRKLKEFDFTLDDVNVDDFINIPNNNVYKICSVTDSVPVVAIDKTIFKSVIGTEQEAFRFAYINEEHAAKQQWTKDEKGDDHYYTKNANEDWNLVRGIFSPYLGIVSDTNERDNRYCHTFNIYYPEVANPEELRMQDNSAYYTISDIYTLGENNEGIKETSDINLYRGDCYLCTFTHRLNRNFNDPTAPTNDHILDTATWRNNYVASTKGDEEVTKLGRINRGDINAVKLGSWITIKVRSSYNLSIRSLDESYLEEKGVMGRARGFYPLQQASPDGGYKITNSYLINDGFGSTVGERWYNTITDAPYLKNEFQNRIVYSDIQENDAFVNGYRVFRGGHYRDYTKQYGQIVKLVEVQSNLLCVFEHGVALIPIKERALAAEGSGGEVFINNSNVLPETIKVLSDTYGSQWADSVLKTAYYTYGIDSVAKKIWRTNGSQFEIISDFKVEKFLLDNIPMGENDTDVYIGLKNIKTHYNAGKQDVMFTLYYKKFGYDEYTDGCKEVTRVPVINESLEKDEIAWNLCYNEISGTFQTFFSWIPIQSANIDNVMYSFDRECSREIIYEQEMNTHNVPDYPDEYAPNTPGKEEGSDLPIGRTTPYIWKHGPIDVNLPKTCYWYDEQHPFEFEFVVNDKPQLQKIFNNLEIISNKAEPESFHFTIEGEEIDFAEDKPNMYYRQEATKALYNNLGSNITYNPNYQKLTNFVKQPRSTIFPLYYKRIDTHNDIYDSYTQMLSAGLRDYKNLSGSEIGWDEVLNQFYITTHIKNSPIDKVGRMRGNSHYIGDKWKIQIPSITFMQKNENWTDIPPILIDPDKVPEDVTQTNITQEQLPNTHDIGQVRVEKWTNRKETRLRDKYAKIKIRYSGTDLAIILAIVTSYT